MISTWKLRCFVASVLFVAAAGVMAADGIPRVHTTVERMSRERLLAAHEDVQRIKAERQPVSIDMGLNDYRVILHAHAEDSAHTGGTRSEMLADAKVADVDAIFLSDHFRPPRDFITESWRGLREGVLFVPGSESHGFLIHPMESVMDKMELEREAFVEAITEGDGLAFLSHVEDRPDHPMDGLTGMEIYNRHADAKDDNASMLALMRVVVDPDLAVEMAENLKRYPDELLASQLDYPEEYFDKWDRETQIQRVVGIAANDCHHNQVFVTKMVDDETVLVGTIVDDDDEMRRVTAAQFPSIKNLTEGHEPGDVLVELDFDPYRISYHNVSTHVLAAELTETALRRALKSGHAYVSHDWMCDPAGFAFLARDSGGKQSAIMGDEIPWSEGVGLVAAMPASCLARLVRDGEVVGETRVDGSEVSFAAEEPGVYRVEAWLQVDGEMRPWIYSNPIYLR